MKKRYSIIFLFPLLFVLLFTVTSSAYSNFYAHIRLTGTVNPVNAEHIVESIETANEDGASFILLTVDTPGGLMVSMRDIIKAIMGSGVPVVVYTHPKGAQAASAGGFIMLSGHVTAMAPGTEIGAMHPVSPGLTFYNEPEEGKEKEALNEKNVMGMKVLNDTVAYGKSLAQKHGRSEEWVEHAIVDAVSSTYLEAHEAGIVDYVAENIPDLLNQLDGSTLSFNDMDYTFETELLDSRVYGMSGVDRFFNFFADPQVLMILFIIAVAGIGFEVRNPGTVFPGVVGGLALLMFLMVIRVIPVNYFAVALIVIAIGLFIAEIFITSFGLLTLGGLVCFVSGSLLLFDNPIQGFSVSIPTIVFGVLFVFVLVFIVMRAVKDAFGQKEATGHLALVGKSGECTIPVEQEGKVMVHGELWTAVSDTPIRKGEYIEVVETQGMMLKVKRKGE